MHSPRAARARAPAFALALALVLAALAPAAARRAGAAEEEEGEGALPGRTVVLQDTWYAQALAYSDVGINVTHFWSKGPRFRAETVIAGRRIVTIVSGERYYAYDSVAQRGLDIGRSPRAIQQDEDRGRPFGNEVQAVLRQGAEKVRVEELGGREVAIYRITDDAGKRQVWASTNEDPLPLRIEIYRRSTGSTVRTDFLNWQRGLSIADGFFEPSASIDFTRVGYDEYVEKQADRKPFGPVPVLYGDLLHGAPE